MASKGWSFKNPADLDKKGDDYNQQKDRKRTWKDRMFRKLCLLVFRKARDNFWTKSIVKINDYRNFKTIVLFKLFRVYISLICKAYVMI